MQPRFVDLHTHTTASDGTDAPRDLIRRAASLKLAAVAVTDHDTVSGLDEAEAAGREYGVEIIRGCELGVQGQYGEIHLLGLWLPRHSAPLDAELARLRGHREERNLKILDRLRSIGINIGYQEVLDEAGGESVGRPHIARVLQKRGIVSNFAQAFELYLGYYGAAYVPRTLLTPEEGVSLMADLGAVVSFAHPMLIRCPPSWFDEIIPRLKEAGLGEDPPASPQPAQRGAHPPQPGVGKPLPLCCGWGAGGPVRPRAQRRFGLSRYGQAGRGARARQGGLAGDGGAARCAQGPAQKAC